jgi:prepilin-type N-terminal cleavage/methylation domain-containing protein
MAAYMQRMKSGGVFKQFRRQGFTLVELLVVMAIITVLMAVLLPAIQSARESSRAAACRNHVGQLAKAMLHYEASQQTFPSGGWGDVWLGVAERGGGIKQPGGWTFSILPFLDEEALLGKVMGISAGDAAGRYQDLASTPLPVFACPSRRTAQALTTAGESYRGAVDTSVSLPTAMRSDYAANGGSSGSCPSLEVYRSIASDPLVSSKSISVCHVTGNNGGGNTLSVSISAMFGNGGHGNHSGDYVGVCLQCSSAVVVTSPNSLSQGDAWTQESLAA